MNNPSIRRLIENEVIFREANKSVAEFVEESPGSAAVTTVRFYCECSREDCRKRIELTPEKYTELHQNSRQFIALPGHDIPYIEKVLNEFDGFILIEKYELPPTPEELNLAVKKIKV